MKTAYPEFAPLETERATELQDIINRAGHDKQPVIIDPDGSGVTGTEDDELVSPGDHTNALVRYQRHY